MKMPTSLLLLEVATLTCSSAWAPGAKRRRERDQRHRFSWQRACRSVSRYFKQPQLAIGPRRAVVERSGTAADRCEIGEERGQAREKRIAARELGHVFGNGAGAGCDRGFVGAGARHQEIEHARLRRVGVEPAQRAFRHEGAAIERNRKHAREPGVVVGQHVHVAASRKLGHDAVRDRALQLRVSLARLDRLGAALEIEMDRRHGKAEQIEDHARMLRHAAFLRPEHDALALQGRARCDTAGRRAR